MKEWFSLFKSDSLQIRCFHHAFPLFMPKNKRANRFSSLFLLFVKNDICCRRNLLFEKSESLLHSQKTSDSHEKQKSDSQPCLSPAKNRTCLSSLEPILQHFEPINVFFFPHKKILWCRKFKKKYMPTFCYFAQKISQQMMEPFLWGDQWPVTTASTTLTTITITTTLTIINHAPTSATKTTNT